MKKYFTLLLSVASATVSVFAAEINVLRLKGHGGSSVYSSIESNALSLGSDSIRYSQYSGDITLSILNQYAPDVLIISNPSGGNDWYTTDEKDAIISYLSQEDKGRGILGEGYVFNSIGDTRPKLHFMAPIFGFRDGIVFDNVAQSGVFDVISSFEDSSLFENLNTTYTSSGFLKGNIPSDGGWNESNLNNALIVASGDSGNSVITVYDAPNYRAIYVSVWSAYQGSLEDQQFIYNSISNIYNRGQLSSTVPELGSTTDGLVLTLSGEPQSNVINFTASGSYTIEQPVASFDSTLSRIPHLGIWTNFMDNAIGDVMSDDVDLGRNQNLYLQGESISLLADGAPIATFTSIDIDRIHPSNPTDDIELDRSSGTYPALSGNETISWTGSGTFTLNSGTFDMFNPGLYYRDDEQGNFSNIYRVVVLGDTDGDGLDDYVETNTGVYASETDTGTDPNNADTDGDDVPDGLEVTEETDPNDPNHFNSFSTGLIAYYPFNGNATDESGNGHNGVNNNASLTSDRYGNASQSYSFNGVNSYIEMQDAADFTTSSLTVSAYVRTNSNKNSQTIFSNYGKNDVGNSWYTMHLYPSLTPRIQIDNGSLSPVVISSQEINQSDWVQVVGSYDDEEQVLRIYANGELLGENFISFSSPINPTGNPSIGVHFNLSGDGRYFSGQIDDVRIYDRALSEAEVAALYYSEAPQFQIIEGDFTWHEAKADAENRGGRLAVLNTQEKIDAANAYIKNVGNWPNMWIGLTDQLVEGQWEWISGEELGSATNWYGGRADSFLPEEDYAIIYRYAAPHQNGEWADVPNDGDGIGSGLEYGYLLEIVASKPLAPVLSLDTFYESNSGESVTVDATPTDGYPATYAYQWYLNGFVVPENLGGTASSYTINGTNGNNGTWKVEVTNDTGTTEAQFEYRVFADRDGDGLSNYRESNITNTDPDLLDTDSDGLNDYAEVIDNLTDPNDSDSDDDGLSDGLELITHLTDPKDADSDDDGLTDGAEVNTHLTDPKDSDSDDDTLSDAVEVNTHGTNPNSVDSDSDTLSDADEINTHLTNPTLSDTDSDGLNDNVEINTYSTDPNKSDSSGDGLSDGAVVTAGFNPAVDYSSLGSLYEQGMIDARFGSKMVEIAGGKANIRMTLEETDDIADWSNPSTTNATIQVDLPAGTRFYRFKMRE